MTSGVRSCNLSTLGVVSAPSPRVCLIRGPCSSSTVLGWPCGPWLSGVSVDGPDCLGTAGLTKAEPGVVFPKLVPSQSPFYQTDPGWERMPWGTGGAPCLSSSGSPNSQPSDSVMD